MCVSIARIRPFLLDILFNFYALITIEKLDKVSLDFHAKLQIHWMDHGKSYCL